MNATVDESRKPLVRLGKRFNLDLSEEAYRDVEELAKLRGGVAKSDIFRLALSLLKMVYPAVLKGEQLCLVNRTEKTERVILIPGA